jgi:hypothetical protein
MIFTELIRHAGQSLRKFLGTLWNHVQQLREYRRLNYVSRAKIDGLSLLDSHNIKHFSRLAVGHYRFDFQTFYKGYYSLVFASGSLEVLVVDCTEEFVEVRCLKDVEMSLICIGEIW